MIFKDYYKILGLDTNKVSLDEIKISYREQAKKYHPDVNVGNINAEERFKDINEAYKVLSDIASRRKYDRMWNSHIGRKKSKKESESEKQERGTVFSDFLSTFFGISNLSKNKKNKVIKNIKGENIETQIDVSIKEAFYGVQKKISLRTIEGKMQSFTVKVPAGIRNNEKIRLTGQGKKGQNGGKNGDLLIKINIKDSDTFKLKGYDIHTVLSITPWEAALGTKTKVNSIDEEISIYIPEGIESGEVIKLPQKGYKDGKGGRGNLMVETKIVLPKKITEEEKGLYSKLGEISNFNPRKNNK